MKGYMTVEASLVLPLAFGMMMFVLSLLFYSYDRCLLEQEVMSLLVGSEYLEGEEKASLLEQEIENWYLDKYVWMDIAVRELVASDNRVKLTVEGRYTGPYFPDMEIQRKVTTLSPTFWIRQKNKLEKQLVEGEEADENGVY
ncbi:MAG: hypothetical protein IJZ82_11015 [Lachnospiraceae bacterium]|nr:hypothetical protein [Lachnospiraceae bacterium]